MNNTTVDSYLAEGCGRCDKFQTPACKVHRWNEPLVALRELVLSAGLIETVKWGSPCYMVDGKNVLMVVSFVDCCALQFFKGAALTGDGGLLQRPGPNSQSVRFVKFTSAKEVRARSRVLRALIAQAIDVERSGRKLERTANEDLPAELTSRLASDAKLKKAFEALTPGRQRSHALHVSGAKQAETRERRVDQCAKDILAGRGFNERSRRA